MPNSDSDSVQISFLNQIRTRLPANLSLVDEMAELLNISRDSAYRRLRGETILSLDEVQHLTSRYGISLDTFLTPSKERINFHLKALDADESWFRSILDNLQMILAAPSKEKMLTYDAKDLPIFHYFQFPRLAVFKLYFWTKTFAYKAKFNAGKYDPKQVDNKMIATAERIWETYAQIPSTEIITSELLNVTLRQVEYAYDCGMFTDHQEAIDLCNDCSLLVTHLQHQAETGSKNTYGTDLPGAKYELYLNEVLIGSNTIFVKMDSQQVAFITPNNFNIMMTTHQGFCEITARHIDNMIDKSVLISVSGKKERVRFFNRVEESIQRLKSRMI
jgi:transcriptional regulator with XRE-family HTH domain